jgi:hypothetical protein
MRRRFSEVMILRFMMPTFQIRWTIPEVLVRPQACCRFSSSSSSFSISSLFVFDSKLY